MNKLVVDFRLTDPNTFWIKLFNEPMSRADAVTGLLKALIATVGEQSMVPEIPEEGSTKIITLGKTYRTLQNQSELLKEIAKVIDDAWTVVDNDLQEAMIEEGCKSINVRGLGMFTMRARNMLSVNAGNKQSIFFPYLKESGNDSILKEDVNPKTLGSFLDSHLSELKAQRMEQGMDEIEARDSALEFLKEKGVTYFVKRDIAFKQGE